MGNAFLRWLYSTCRWINRTFFEFILMWMQSTKRKNYCRLWKEPHLGIVISQSATLIEFLYFFHLIFFNSLQIAIYIPVHFVLYFLISLFSVLIFFFFRLILNCVYIFSTDNHFRHVLSESLLRRNLSISQLAIYELPGTSDLSKFQHQCWIRYLL